MTPEAKVKKELRERLESIGAYFFMPVQTGYGSPSLDFLICYQGRFIAIETKAPGNLPTPRQVLIADRIIAAGGEVVMIDSVEAARVYDPNSNLPRPLEQLRGVSTPAAWNSPFDDSHI